MAEILPESRVVDVCLPRAFDRKYGTSITAEEACQLAAIVKCVGARQILEIGTYDGNTTLILAANCDTVGRVTTVDLPPDFDLETERSSLVYAEGEVNLTPRDEVGRQYRGHPLEVRIQQVFGDSAALDWGAFGGPFDLIFIDGCHSEHYVDSDTRNALAQLAPNGAIVWHDYGMIPDVSKVVDRIARQRKDLRVSALEGTRLALGMRC